MIIPSAIPPRSTSVIVTCPTSFPSRYTRNCIPPWMGSSGFTFTSTCPPVPRAATTEPEMSGTLPNFSRLFFHHSSQLATIFRRSAGSVAALSPNRTPVFLARALSARFPLLTSRSESAWMSAGIVSAWSTSSSVVITLYRVNESVLSSPCTSIGITVMSPRPARNFAAVNRIVGFSSASNPLSTSPTFGSVNIIIFFSTATRSAGVFCVRSTSASAEPTASVSFDSYIGRYR